MSHPLQEAAREVHSLRERSSDSPSPAPAAGSSLPVMLPDVAWKQRFRRRLLAWFGRHARDLPWRRTRDPYAIWISEIMLQQTQVATVVDYFTRFLNTFPSVQALAAADEQQVLRCWEGLGYYRRARQLHQAARTIVTQHGGRFPHQQAALLALPGIGRYTAGAIASIAWDARQPILEANTIRLLARLLAYRDDPTRSAGQRLLWEFSAQLLPRRATGAFNQALMELGSEICTPRAPRCESCTLAAYCATRALGLQAEIPAAAKKTPYQAVTEAALVVRRNGDVLLRFCGPQERWAGLWDFPRFAVDTVPGQAFESEWVRRTAELTGQQVRIGRQLTTIKHGVTRFRITLLCHEAHWIAGTPEQDGVRWIDLRHLNDYPLSATGRTISRLLAGFAAADAAVY